MIPYFSVNNAPFEHENLTWLQGVDKGSWYKDYNVFKHSYNCTTKRVALHTVKKTVIVSI